MNLAALIAQLLGHAPEPVQAPQPVAPQYADATAMRHAKLVSALHRGTAPSADVTTIPSTDGYAPAPPDQSTSAGTLLGAQDVNTPQITGNPQVDRATLAKPKLRR